jgi:hypothetical protein
MTKNVDLCSSEGVLGIFCRRQKTGISRVSRNLKVQRRRCTFRIRNTATMLPLSSGEMMLNAHKGL